jgi:hypothetical protein
MFRQLRINAVPVLGSVLRRRPCDSFDCSAALMTNRSDHVGARRSLAKGTAAVLLTSLVVTAPVTATAEDTANRSGDPAVISEWNQIAQTTLLADKSKSLLEDFLYMGFVHAAVYNAVVGIEGGYEPYKFRARAAQGASSEAAAVAAAYKILATYSPAAQHPGLETAYAASLAKIPDDKAKTRGVAFGELAAGTLIKQRADDGRNPVPISATQVPAPGVWRPTPPGLLPGAVPWLGSVTPLLVRSGAQFGEPGPPPSMTSAKYTREFNEVKALGSENSTERTTKQTDTARFYSGNPLIQFNTALRDQVEVRKLDTIDAARMFAAVDMSVADAVISIWHSKYLYNFWRPITAIQLAETDGNPATTADPNWAPMLVTPPYPEYLSGYSGVIGAYASALQETFQTRHLQLTFTSTAVSAPDPDAKRFYDSGSAAIQEVVDARIWLGIHFRSADVRGAQMGQQIAEWALDRYFRPVDQH